jgi:hypothetical protein
MLVGDTFADGVPMRFDGVEGLDVEGRIVVDVENCLPKSMEKEFDFTGAVDGIDAMQGGLAASAIEGGRAPRRRIKARSAWRKRWGKSSVREARNGSGRGVGVSVFGRCRAVFLGGELGVMDLVVNGTGDTWLVRR